MNLSRDGGAAAPMDDVALSLREAARRDGAYRHCRRMNQSRCASHRTPLRRILLIYHPRRQWKIADGPRQKPCRSFPCVPLPDDLRRRA